MSASRLYPDRPLLAASLAVFRDDRVLLAQRFAAPLADRFTLPGGVVEPGETLEQAALREMFEEVGVTARIIGFNRHVELIEYDGDGAVKRHYVIASFVGEWIAGDGDIGPEAKAVVWVDRASVETLPTSDDLSSVLDGAWVIARARSQAAYSGHP